MKRILKSLAFILGMLMLPTVAYTQNIYADVNGDLEVNIADINAVIGVILSDVSNPSADVNGDGEINIADINAVIDFILNGGFDPHLLEVCERVVEIDKVISDYYQQCSSLEELKAHSAEIEALDNVEYVFSNDNTTLYVVIKDFGTISYSYYPRQERTNSLNIPHLNFSRINANAVAEYNHVIEQSEAKALILFQMSKDERCDSVLYHCNELANYFRKAYVNSKVETSLDIEFFRDSIFDCDYVYIATHGDYEFDDNKYEDDPSYRGLHWLLTTEELPSDEDKAIERLIEIRSQYDAKDVSLGSCFEQRNGQVVQVDYIKVSDHFIESSNKSFNHPGKAVVFNMACKSMKGPGRDIYEGDTINYNFARVFARNGAGAYYGYDEQNSHGDEGAIQFYCNLLSGMSIKSAFDNLQFTIQHDYKNIDSKSWWADLIKYIPSQDFDNICIVKPSFEYKDNSNDNELSISLDASMFCGSYDFSYGNDEVAYSANNLSGVLKYGFELSESEQFTDVTRLDEMQIGDDGCSWNEETFNLDFSQSLTYSVGQADSKIMPNTNYWARAYVYDGQGYNYSEPIMFTTGSIGGENSQTETFTVNGVSFTMVAVEGGAFMMGATAEQVDDAESNEYPVHQVTLSSYSIGQTEVTQALWQAVMGSNPSYFTGDLNRPVEEVSWNDCQTFITKLNQMTGKNFRLPNEAEWEYAARGGNRSKGYKYSGSNDIGSVAWYEGNADNVSDRGTRPVATKAPNELGLYDMSGNVWEWCQDWFDNDYGSNSPTENPTGPESGYNRVFRGGSWGYNAAFCRVSRRGSYIPTYHWRSGGLRLVMSGEPEPELQHEYVDLGLPSGTLWATCNVGASAPEEYGNYFAWGETAPKDYYFWSTYKWCNDSYTTVTKYCTNSSYGYNGFTDGKTELDPEDDAAHVNWGPSWRMPTTEQQRELYEKCSSTWTTLNGVSGRLFTGPNGNTLFLPAAGYRGNESLYHAGSWGVYWSRTLGPDSSLLAYHLDFYSGDANWYIGTRYVGRSVRAVRVSQN